MVDAYDRIGVCKNDVEGVLEEWTIDQPAFLDDWLWDVFVVQLAAFLDRPTLRQIIAFVPVVILVVAYYHRNPMPSELMLLGDLLAYIDIFSVLFLLGMMSHAATILFVIKQAVARIRALVTHLITEARRLDFRHRRERRRRRPKQPDGRNRESDDPFVANGIAWA